METLASKIDRSVNFIEERTGGFLESRFVRKGPMGAPDPYFICYLSSHTGCNRGCAMCHLTATGQTSFDHADPKDMLGQAQRVFSHYRKTVDDGSPAAKYVHFNFMARGEALANRHMLEDSDGMLLPLAKMAKREGLFPKFNVSTIMPASLRGPLSGVFCAVTPTIYYSLYSVREDFRKKWLPAAMPVDEALGRLVEYQSLTKKVVKIHHAFIKGENDSDNDVLAVCEAVLKYGLTVEFNLVRYNAFSGLQGEESTKEVIDRNLGTMSCIGRAKEIPRVGPDCMASCGMFIS